MLRIVALLIFSLITCSSCKHTADSPESAMKWLLEVPVWYLSEIKANGTSILKDGKSIPTFSGLEFNRYMKELRFLNEGKVDGVYNIGTAKTTLLWNISPQVIAITSDEASSDRGWSIAPSTVTKTSFIMETSSTAFDFPRNTHIELIYKAEK